MCFNCRELGHTAVSCPKLRRGNKYTNKGDSSQEKEEYKEGVGASNKPKGDVRASVQDHIRSVLESFG